MFPRRRKPQWPRNPHAAEIRLARRELRGIEFELARHDTRVDIDVVRSLTARHRVWREHLARYGVNHPAPQVAW